MLGQHKHAILEFSGGKDSLATLYLARPYLENITVMYGDTGAVYPHVLEFVKSTCENLGAKLEIVKPEIPVIDYTERFGLPSDIVPAWSTHDVSPFLSGQHQLLQSPMTCCGAMLFKPLYDAVQKSGATLVIRGAKKADKRVGVPPGYVENGIEYTSPVWDWSDEDVFAYLEKEGAELPGHYKTVKDSLDCWICTAHMPYGPAAEKLSYTKQNYPELWPVVSGRLIRVRNEVERANMEVRHVIDDFIEVH